MCSLRRLLQYLAEHLHAKSEQGVAAIEYTLIAGIMVLAIVAGVTAIGISLSSIFGGLAGRFPT